MAGVGLLVWVGQVCRQESAGAASDLQCCCVAARYDASLSARLKRLAVSKKHDTSTNQAAAQLSSVLICHIMLHSTMLYCISHNIFCYRTDKKPSSYPKLACAEPALHSHVASGQALLAWQGHAVAMPTHGFAAHNGFFPSYLARRSPHPARV